MALTPTLALTLPPSLSLKLTLDRVSRIGVRAPWIGCRGPRAAARVC